LVALEPGLRVAGEKTPEEDDRQLETAELKRAGVVIEQLAGDRGVGIEPHARRESVLGHGQRERERGAVVNGDACAGAEQDLGECPHPAALFVEEGIRVGGVERSAADEEGQTAMTTI
jgi:hypothetical protein